MRDLVIVVGSGKFPLQVAKLVLNRISNICIFEAIPDGAMSVLNKLACKQGILYNKLTKESLLKFIKNNSDKSILLLSAWNAFIFTKEFFEFDNLKMVNYHPALLPNHPGRNTEAWCIFEGDSETGITWHILEKKVDTGDIVIQKSFVIYDDMTSLDVMQKQFIMGLESLSEIIDDLINDVEKKVQHNKRRGKFHFASDIPNDGQLDFLWEDKKKSAFLRAMDYGKLELLGVPFVQFDGRKMSWRSYEIYDANAEICEVKENDILIKGKSINIVLQDCYTI